MSDESKPTLDAIYAAWRAVGADVAGLDWAKFVGHIAAQAPAEGDMLLRALVRIADPRNTHFAGDAQVVAREALAALPNVQPKGTPAAVPMCSEQAVLHALTMARSETHQQGDAALWQAFGRAMWRQFNAMLPAAPSPAPGAGLPAGWRLATVSDGDIRVYGPDKETWLIRKDSGEGFYDFIHRFFEALASQAPAAGAGPTGQQVIDGLRAAMEKANVPGDCRADLVGHFCNEWNRLHSASKPSVQGSQP